VGHPGVALVLLQEPPDGARTLRRARHLHPALEAEEHAPLADGRGDADAPGCRVLRLAGAPRPRAGAASSCWRGARASARRPRWRSWEPGSGTPGCRTW